MKNGNKKPWLRQLISIGLIICMVLSIPGFQAEAAASVNAAATPFSTHGKLSVRGTHLVDKDGNNFQIQGVSTHGLAWYPAYVNKEAFRTMRDEWNVNTVRLAMYTEEYGGYCTTDENGRTQLKNLIVQAVQSAYDLGMYVIVDWHVLSDLDPNRHKQEAMDFFREMSSRLKSYGNVIYEICNEPNGGTSWDSIRSYAIDVIDVIRQNVPDSVIIVGTPTWSQDVDIAADRPIERNNLLYALHFYAATHTDHYRSKAITALNKGLPIIVSEFGICDASGNGGVNTYEANKWMELLDNYQIGYAIWSLCNKAETASLIRPNCSAVSGWSYNDLSESGQWYVNYQTKKTPVLADVTGLRAVGGLGSTVMLTWNRSAGAEGYLIYGRRGSGAYGYIGITTSGTTYTDNSASSTQYNYYWVYPYYTRSGKRVVGGCAGSAYAKSIGQPAAISGLKAQSLGDAVRLTWNAAPNANGYLIYGRRGSGAYGYIGIASGTSYTDQNAPLGQNTYYWVYPYYNLPDGSRATGTCASSVYGRKLGQLPAVSGIRTQSLSGAVKLTWNAVSGATAYLIYGKRGSTGVYGYIGLAAGTEFMDTKAPSDVYSFYWIYPYCKDTAGKNVIGIKGDYSYGIAR